MKSIQTWNNDGRQTETIGGERRTDKRYGLRLQLRWKLLRRRRVIDSGIGCTVDMSSGGIRFEAGRELPAGLNVELAIAWPMLLRDITPIQLVVTGKIVRSTDRWVALRTVTHEFRTHAVATEHRESPVNVVRAPGVLIQMEKGASIGVLQ